MSSYFGFALAIAFIGFGGFLAIAYPFLARRDYRRSGARPSRGVILHVVLDTVWAYGFAFGFILLGMFVWDEEGQSTFAAIFAALSVWAAPVSLIAAELALLADRAVQARMARHADNAPT